MEDKIPYRYLNGKFPGFIGLTKDQYLAVYYRDLISARNLGLSTNDYMSLIDKDYPKDC
jgi:hypothetical protein